VFVIVQLQSRAGDIEFARGYVVLFVSCGELVFKAARFLAGYGNDYK
jgi:hypothetical protein